MNDNENKTNAPIKLLPCPICNGDAHIFWDVDTDEPDAIAWHRAECRIKRCVSTSNFTTPEQAAEIWNTRNEADALRAEVEGLRKDAERLCMKVTSHAQMETHETFTSNTLFDAVVKAEKIFDTDVQ